MACRATGRAGLEAGELGRGRPGWHRECVCIAEEALGLPFDIQAVGGSDLIFPHHDLSAAHSVALGRPFATSYAHSGMAAYEGEKSTSKLLGNRSSCTVWWDGVDPMAIRPVLMAHHSPARMGVVGGGA